MVQGHSPYSLEFPPKLKVVKQVLIVGLSPVYVTLVGLRSPQVPSEDSVE